jgi:hypothetical protein
MATRTASVLLALEAALQGVQGANAIGTLVECGVYIDRVRPFERGEAPSVVLRFENEDAQEYGGAAFNGHEQIRARARLEVAIYVVGERPVLLAEQTFEQVHARLMADPSVGSRISALNYTGRRWRAENEDGPVGSVVALYDLIYIASERTLD